jgi:hypothetical protein
MVSGCQVFKVRGMEFTLPTSAGVQGWIKAATRNTNILLALNDKSIQTESEDYCSLGCNALWSDRKVPNFGRSSCVHLHDNLQFQKLRMLLPDVFKFTFAQIFF